MNSADRQESIFDLCDEFEDSWAIDEHDAVRSFVDRLPSGNPTRTELLLELVKLDLELRWRHAQIAFTEAFVHGEHEAGTKIPLRPRVEFYTAEFPELQTNGELWRQLINHEYIVRHTYGDQPSIDSFVVRFPQCHQLTRSLSAIDTANASVRARRSSGVGNDGASFTVECQACHSDQRVGFDADFLRLTCAACDENIIVPDESNDRPLAVIDRFELQHRIGKGGFGTVWRAFDPRMQRLVAIKILHAYRSNELDRKQFFEEAATASQLDHPNIVSVHESGRSGDIAFIVFALVEGRSLADFGGTSDFKRIAAWCRDVALGLQHAHQLGVVHRDIKPENVLINRAGVPLVADFGLAKRTLIDSSDSITGDIKGTPAFCSPEQASGSGHKADERCDIYSLGAVLYFLLTGQPPFGRDEDAGTLLQKVIHDEPVSPRKRRGTTPADLETICLKCLQKDPNRRFESAQELAEDLDRFVNGQPIKSRRTPLAIRATRWCRRHPAWAAAMVLALGNVCIAAFLLARTSMQNQVERYDATIQSAFEDWEARQFENAKEQLEDKENCPIELREFTWGLVDRLCNPLLKKLHGHTGCVTCLAMSRDNSVLYSTGVDGLLLRWDLPLADSKVIDKCDDEINALALSPDESLVAIGLKHGEIRVRHVGDEQTVVSHPFQSEVTALQFSASQDFLMAADSDGRVCTWNIGDGGHLDTDSEAILPFRVFYTGEPTVGFVSGESTLAYLNEAGRLAFWDLETERSKWSEPSLLPNSGPRGFSLTCHATEKLVAVNFSTSTTVIDLRLSPPKVINSLRQFNPGCPLGFVSEQDEVVAVQFDGNRQAVVRWDPISHDVKVVGHDSDWVSTIVASGDGSTIASGSVLGAISVRKTRPESWQSIPAVEAYDQVTTATLWKENIVVSGQAGLRSDLLVVNPSAGTVVHKLASFSDKPGQVYASDVSSQGILAIAVGLDVELWDLNDWTKLASIEPTAMPGRVNDLEFSRDGNFLATCAANKVYLFDIANPQEPTEVIDHGTSINALAFSPLDPTQMLAVTEDGKVLQRQTNANGPCLQFDAHPGPIRTIQFTPDGSLFATAGDDMDIGVWSAPGKRLALLKGHRSSVVELAFSSDGKTLVSAARKRETKFWHMRTSRELISLGGQRQPHGLIFLDGDEALLSIGDDPLAPAKVWRSSKGEGDG